jgi:ligand-binding sensor domain-containing protein
MKIFRQLLICCILWSLGFTGLSQTLRFEKYTSRDGLPSDDIYNLYQDKKGYLWVFTNYGALKFNGAEFKPILKNLPLQESFVYSIFENKNGRIWIANSNAMVYEVKNDSAFILNGSSFASNILRKDAQEIYQIYVDDSLNVFLITKSRSFKLVKKGNSYESRLISIKANSDPIGAEIFEKPGFMVPVKKYSEQDFKSLTPSVTYSILIHTANKDFTILVSGEKFSKFKYFKRFGNDIYFSFYPYLHKVSGNGTQTKIPLPDILNFVKDKRNHMWIAGFNKGLIELDEKDSLINNYLKEVTVNDVLVDSENGIWASSAGGGLYHLKDINTRYFSETEPLGKNIQFIKSIDDQIFIANSTGELYTVSDNKPKLVRKEENKETQLDMIKYNSSYVVSSRHKQTVLNSTRQKTLKVSNSVVVENNIKMQAIGKNKIFFCSRNALGLVDNGKLKNLAKVDRKLYGFEFRKKKLMLATDNGIYELGQKDLEDLLCTSSQTISNLQLLQPTYLQNTNGITISRIVNDERGNLWFCSEGSGLFILNRYNKVSQRSLSEGLPANIIHDISFDRDSSILISTNKGLFISYKNGSEAISWKKILNREVKQAIIFDGKIYAATTAGLIIVDHKKFINQQKRYLNLNSVLVNSKEINAASLGNLHHTQNNLEFNFDLISFSKDRSRILYSLSGPLNEKGILKNSSLKLPHSSPGNYILTVLAEDDQNLKVVIRFNIVPAFWQTKGFIIVLCLLFLIICFFILRLIAMNIRKKEIEGLRSANLISEYRLSAITAQMDPHFIFNSLNSIQQFIIARDNEKAQLYLSRFSRLLRKLLESNIDQMISLKDEKEIYEKYLEIESLRFNNVFDWQIIMAVDIDVSATFIPNFLIQPFIENAICHGLLPKKGYKLLKVIFERIDERSLRCTIDDNGVGRKAAALNKNQQLTVKNKTLGLSIVQQRLLIMSKLNGGDYHVKITDKEDFEGTPTGTKVELVMPILKQL